MQRSNLKSRILLVIPCATLLLAGTGLTSLFGQTEPPSTILTAQQFTMALFPELDGKGNIMTVRISGTFETAWTHLPPFDLEVWKTDPGHPAHIQTMPPPNHEHDEKPLLGAYFSFEPDGAIQSISFAGAQTTFGRENKKLQNLVQSHPEWTTKQAVQALKSAGAKYGPDDLEDFKRAIPVTQLERFLGKLTVKSVEFRSLAEDRVGWFVRLLWEVDVEAQREDGHLVPYSMSFEPFQGKLILLGKFPSITPRPTP